MNVTDPRRGTVGHPVADGHRRTVMARRTVIEDGQHFVGLLAEGLERNVRVRSVAIARRQRQVTQKISRVQTRQGQAVTVA